MKLTKVSLLLSLVVSFVSVGSLAKATEHQSTRKYELAMRNAYVRTYEAKVCIDATAVERYELAMGFCYSWFIQALAEDEKTAAYILYTTAFNEIQEGISSERE